LGIFSFNRGASTAVIFSAVIWQTSMSSQAGDLLLSTARFPREDDVIGSDWVAAGKLGVRVQREGHRPGVAGVGDLPGLSQHAHNSGAPGLKETNVSYMLPTGQNAAKLIGDGRVERDDVGHVGGEESACCRV
jgi:hypothetical protein